MCVSLKCYNLLVSSFSLQIQVKTVVDQAAVQKLEEVSQEKLNLEFALKKIKRELEDQVSDHVISPCYLSKHSFGRFV